MFDLPALLALAEETTTQPATISPATVNIVLAALGYIQDPANWTGADPYTLSAEELDQIDALAGQVAADMLAAIQPPE